MKLIATLLKSVTVVLLAISSASADTLLSNFQQANSYSASMGSGSPSGRYAAEFFAGSLAPVWDMTAVTLKFGGPTLWGAQNNGPILYSAYIFSGANNKPTSQLASLGSFNFTSQTDSILQVTLNPSTQVSLTANSEYWIVVGAVTSCPGGILEGTGTRRNDVVGSNWHYGIYGSLFDGGTFLPTSGGTSTTFLEIQAVPQAVPEPSMLALAGVAAAALYRRWKRP
jgi:hypothetical protein